jgi:hypothetical protein
MNPDDLDDPIRPDRIAAGGELEQLAASEGWEALPGWFDFADIYRDVAKHAPRGALLVEVGVAFGRSLAFLARQAIDLERDDLEIVGVDLWGHIGSMEDPISALVRETGGDFYEAFRRGMERHCPLELERITVLRNHSAIASRHFGPGLMFPRPWFVFIDADHTYEGVRSDLAAWGPRILPGGIFAGHDFTEQFPGVGQAVTGAYGAGVERRGNSWWRRMP